MDTNGEFVRIRLLSSVLSALALLAAMAGSSMAAGPATSGAEASKAVAGAVVVQDAESRAVAMDLPSGGTDGAGTQAATCWSAFAPPQPEGLPMYQYYRNCNGYGLWVAPGYVLNGTLYQTADCVFRTIGSYYFWYYSSTISTAAYGTYACA